MSRVFVANDRSLGRVVAIKVLSPEVAAELKAERFRLEIQLAAKLQHPHIVPLLFAGETNGILYFTMPFIEGESLRARIGREGPLPLHDAIRTLRQIASALAYAHKQGVVHRDIKPDNVLLAGEFALVTDFGVAKALTASTTADGGGPQITSSGMAIGTPAYMAPEQALADPGIDHRADIYSFGIVAYEVLTGSPPFRMKTAQATLAAHVTATPERIETKRTDLPPSLASVLMSCLEKRPEDRPQSATELLQAFDAVVTGSAVSGERVVTVSAPQPAPKRSMAKRVLAGAGAVAIAAAAWYGLAPSAPKVSATMSNLSSIAVLPLENVGGDSANEYFSDGMTDELASALSKLPGLRVASRTSAYSFKGQRTDVSEIGRKLNVQAVIEGSVQRSGNLLKVTAQLTSVADGLTLWSDTYQRDARDVFAVQDEVARSIAAAVRPRLGNQTQTLSQDNRGTANLGAFDAYLRGRHLWNARGAVNLRRAITYFDSAIAQDPGFARAHAGRAIAYALLPEYTDSPPPRAWDEAREAAQRALSLNPSLAEAYTAIGLSSLHEWRFEEAAAAYRKAIELDPNYATAHQWYGELLYHRGATDSALVHIKAARDLDPLAPILPSAMGYGLYVDRQYDAAIAELRRGIELAPTLGLHHAMIANPLMMKGRYAEAVRELETAVRLEPELSIRQGYLAYAYGKSGQEQEARRIIDRVMARNESGRPSAMALTLAWLGLGEREKAIRSLEQAVATHDIGLLTASSLLPDPIYDPLRGDPRFFAVLEKMNLAKYVGGR